MAPIGSGNATRKFKNKKSTLSSISMDSKWFMDDMPSYPPILFSFFVLRFFGVYVVIVGCYFKVKFIGINKDEFVVIAICLQLEHCHI